MTSQASPAGSAPKNSRRKRALIALAITLALLGVAALSGERARDLIRRAWMKTRSHYTVAQRLTQFEAAVEARLRPQLEAVGLPYPPDEVTLIAFKDTRTLEVYARAGDAPWVRVTAYPILGASGTLGPKLAEGDKQVPEGIYAVESLNPNSRFHLSLRLSYPNDFDRAHGLADGRADLGGDIMIHGSDASIGCLAMGDPAAEDLFILTALTGASHVSVLIAPTDLHDTPPRTPLPTSPPWVQDLYAHLRAALAPYPR